MAGLSEEKVVEVKAALMVKKLVAVLVVKKVAKSVY